MSDWSAFIKDYITTSSIFPSKGIISCSCRFFFGWRDLMCWSKRVVELPLGANILAFWWLCSLHMVQITHLFSLLYSLCYIRQTRAISNQQPLKIFIFL